MSKQSLEVLFESRTRLKILKFLFRNFPKSYSSREIVAHTQEDTSAVRKELKRLMEIGLIENKKTVYGISPEFEYFTELRDLIIKSSPSEKRDLIERIHKLGKIRVAIISGIFLDKELNDPLAVDLFLVHDYLDKRKLTLFLKAIESEIGTEVRFAAMDKEEFKYRLAMFDRFVRVLLEGPHEKLINKLGIE
ncbi:MAG: winged helix-turn-helix domain-containing protein [Patescibacteria group bacterium]